MRRWIAIVLAWALVLGGAYLASRIQTAAGAVTVSEVRVLAQPGVEVSGLLYRPATATPQSPAPAVLVSHGYINTREMQSPFAIELSRRGYVVLAMDMTGHGYSGGVVGTAGFGGPAALRYLKSLPFVDRRAIGLEGHSMGGGPVMAAALADPDGYRAIVLEGSTPGLLGAPAPANPRNLAVVFGQYDEFAGLMWGVPKGSEIAASPKLQALFGVAEPVQARRLYGSIADGSARWMTNPPITHPWEHFSASGVGNAVEWLQRVIPAPAPRPPADQVWIWKEVGTLVAFIGFGWLVLATFDMALTVPPLRALAHPGEPAAERRDRRWWLWLVLTAALPAVTYLPLMKVGQLFFPMPGLAQWVHNQLLVWALGTAAITVVLGLVLKTRATFTNRWGLSAFAAILSVATGYFALVVVDSLFKVDFRFWVVGLKPLSPERAAQLPAYLLLWTVFFLIAMRAFCARIPVRGEGWLASLAWAKTAMAGGFLVLVGWQYATLFGTGLLATPTEPLNVVIALQFVPLLGFVGVIGAWTWRRTNSYVPGALICALFMSWYITAGTANHWAPGFEFQVPGAATAKR
ncbi:alpha/beta hydrolase [Phenylobacterium kunshanense]|uniref:Alpha/beta hydrolase n=1 Tax=Phenylobacterium kunshanense TaxID=1445034 RepID=A0A328BCK5_9CAUL|nr:alpha/beta fold hydrolase [Phenylobacterium kunshanense]RAK63596.1 alpha/beta hydrolase [Phenylobacterium kunshanense]